jgi:hypothetical protein
MWTERPHPDKYRVYVKRCEAQCKYAYASLNNEDSYAFYYGPDPTAIKRIIAQQHRKLQDSSHHSEGCIYCVNAP